MSHELWIVEGRSGQYSDRQTWPVCWFDTEEAAEAHAKTLQALSDGLDRDDWDARSANRDRMAAAGDPCWSDWGDPAYYVYSIPAGPGQSGE